MRRALFVSGALSILLLAAACDDDDPGITEPVIQPTSSYTLEIHQTVNQTTREPGNLVVVPTHTLTATSEDEVRPDTLRDVTITFPDEDVDFSLAGFEQVDGAWAMAFDGSGRDEPMPPGTYSVVLRARSFDGWTFDSDHTFNLLETTPQALILSDDRTEARFAWMPPADAHTWTTGVYRITEDDEGEEVLELVTEGPSGELPAGAAEFQEVLLSLDGLEEDDGWVVRLVLEGDRTTRIADALEPEFAFQVGQTIHQSTDDPDALTVVPTIRMTSMDAVRPDTLHEVTVEFPDGTVQVLDPAFQEDQDDGWVMEVDGSERDEVVPDGDYTVRLRFSQFGGWAFEAEGSADPLDLTVESLVANEERTEATLTWTAPDAEHEWETGLYRMTEEGEIELVEGGPSDESEGDEELEAVLPLDGLNEGDTWFVRLTVTDGTTTRVVDVKETGGQGDDEESDEG